MIPATLWYRFSVHLLLLLITEAVPLTLGEASYLTLAFASSIVLILEGCLLLAWTIISCYNEGIRAKTMVYNDDSNSYERKGGRKILVQEDLKLGFAYFMIYWCSVMKASVSAIGQARRVKERRARVGVSGPHPFNGVKLLLGGGGSCR